jgi:hypothetical protein
MSVKSHNKQNWNLDEWQEMAQESHNSDHSKVQQVCKISEEAKPEAPCMTKCWQFYTI